MGCNIQAQGSVESPTKMNPEMIKVPAKKDSEKKYIVDANRLSFQTAG